MHTYGITTPSLRVPAFASGGLFTFILLTSSHMCPCCAAALLLLAGSRLTLSDQLVAAVGASCAVSLVATPTELLKCRLQAQGCSATARQRLVEAGLDPSKHAIYRTPMGTLTQELQSGSAK